MGGYLLIGVGDTGAILGLDDDYEIFKNKNSKDFEKHLKSIIEKQFKNVNFDGTKNVDVAINLSLDFHTLGDDDKEICVCKIYFLNTYQYL